MKRILLFTLLACGLGMADAQQFKHTVPYSQREDFIRNKPGTSEAVPVPHIVKDDVDTEAELAFLESDQCVGCGGEVGVYEDVDIDFFREAKRTKLKNGGELFQLEIELKTAKGAEFIFDQIELSDRAELFVIDENGSSVGAITRKQIHENPYTTFPVEGNVFTIELYDPYGESNEMNIHLSELVYRFRGNIEVVDESSKYYQHYLSCFEYDILDQSIAQPYQEYKNAIGMMLSRKTNSISGKTYQAECSGALINNTSDDGKPYFFTASHCLAGFSQGFDSDQGPVSVNEVNPILSIDNSFIFNYEYGKERYVYVQGADILSIGKESDYALLKLHQKPQRYTDVYFLGWDRTTQTIGVGDVVGIHHPSGLRKMLSYSSNDIGIATPSFQLNEGVYEEDYRTALGQFWAVEWTNWNTAPGSSGSPLIKANSDKIIGSLQGGYSACVGEFYNGVWQGPDRPDFYGVFGHSWDNPSGAYYGDDNILKELPPVKDYLDPTGIDPQVINGFNPLEPVIEDVEVNILGNVLTTELNTESYRADVFLNGSLLPEHKISYAWEMTDAVDGQLLEEGGGSVFDFEFKFAGTYKVELTALVSRGDHEVAQVHSRIIKVLDNEINENDRLTFLIEPSTLYTDKYEIVSFNIVDARLGNMPVNSKDLAVTWGLGVSGVQDFLFNDQIEAYFTSTGYPQIEATATINIAGKIYNHTQYFSSLRVSDGNPGALEVVIDIQEGSWYPEKDEPITFIQEVYLNGDEISDWTELNITWDFGEGASPETANGVGPHKVIYSIAGAKIVKVNSNMVYEEQDFLGEREESFTVGDPSLGEIEMTIKGCPGNLTSTVGNTPSEYYDLSLETDFNFNHVPQANYKWYNGDESFATGTFPGRLYGASDIKVELYSGYGSDAQLIKTIEKERCAYYGPFEHITEIGNIIQYGRCLDDAEIVVQTFSSYNNNDLEVWMETHDGQAGQVLYKSKETVQLSHTEYFNEYKIDLSNYVNPIQGNVTFKFVIHKFGQTTELDAKDAEINTYQFDGIPKHEINVGACYGQPTALLSQDFPNDYSYTWRGSASDLSLLNDIHSVNPQFFADAEREYHYVLEARDPVSGCEREIDVRVTAQSLGLSQGAFELCNGIQNDVELTPVGGSGNHLVEWLPSFYITEANSSRVGFERKLISQVVPSTTNLQSFNQVIRITDDKGCNGDVNVTIQTSNPTTIDLDDTYYGQCGGEVTIKAPGAQYSGGTHAWYKNGDSEPYTTNRTLTTEEPGDFELVIDNGRGCKTKASTYIEAFKVAGGLNPGKPLYTKELQLGHLGESFTFSNLGDVNGDGVEDLLAWGSIGRSFDGSVSGSDVGYILIMDQFGNMTSSYFVISKSLISGDFVEKEYGIDRMKLIQKYENGRFKIAIASGISGYLSYPDEVYFNNNNEKVWVLTFSFDNGRFVADNQRVQLVAERRVGSMFGDNHFRIPFTATVFDPSTIRPNSAEESPIACGISIPVFHYTGQPYYFSMMNPIYFEAWKKSADNYGLGRSPVLSDRFGKRISSVADLDGDGNNELIVSIPGCDDDSDYPYVSVVPEVSRKSVFYKGVILPTDFRNKMKNYGGFYLLYLDDDGNPKKAEKISGSNGNHKFNFTSNEGVVNTYYSQRSNLGLGWIDWTWINSVTTSYRCSYNSFISPSGNSLSKQLGDEDIISVGDVDGDGFEEFVTTTKRIRGADYFVMGFRRTNGVLSFFNQHINRTLGFTHNIGDLDNDGIDEMLAFDNQVVSWDANYNQKWSRDISSFLLSNKTISAVGDLNNDGIPDLIQEEGRGVYTIHFLDGIPDENEGFMKERVDLCGPFICSYDNRNQPIRAEKIVAGYDYCDETFTEYDFGNEGTHELSTLVSPVGNLSSENSCRFREGDFYMELRASEEMVFGPGVKITPAGRTNFDFRAKMFDPEALEDCYATPAQAKFDEGDWGEEWTSSTHENDALEEEGVRLVAHPNPVTGVLFVDLSSREEISGSIQLLDYMGQMIDSRSVRDGMGSSRFDLSQNPEGVYFVRHVNEMTGESKTEKVIVVH